MNEKKKNRTPLIALITIFNSLVLMNLGRLDGIVPDNVIRILGTIVLIATGLSVFFAVRSLMKAKENENISEKE